MQGIVVGRVGVCVWGGGGERRGRRGRGGGLKKKKKKKGKGGKKKIWGKAKKEGGGGGVHVHIGRWGNRLPFLIDNQLCCVPIHIWSVGQVYSTLLIYKIITLHRHMKKRRSDFNWMKKIAREW